MGASLIQDVGWRLKPVKYYSKNLIFAETRYTTHDRKLLVILASFEVFRTCVSAGNTMLDTDNDPLKYVTL